MWNHLKEKGINLPNITSEKIDEQLRPILTKMQKIGITLNVEVFKHMAKDIEGRLKELEKSISIDAGCQFNIASPAQMAEVLFVKLKLPTDEIKRTKNGFSTAAPELIKIQDQHPIIAKILEYREKSKLLSTYLIPLPQLIDENSRLHTTYGTDTTTGRLTSNNPNLQNIPIRGELGIEIRKAFMAAKGMELVSADYSQIELRVVACLSDDKAMKEAFQTGEDIHTKTAMEIFDKPADKITKDERRFAKTINFGILYGMSPYGLSQSLKIPQEEAAEYIKKYNEVHLGIKKYCADVIEFAQKNGYVETLFGFRRHLPNINNKTRFVREAEERMAINSPVQGSAAEIMKLAMINLDRALEKLDPSGQKARLLLTIHDELVIECDKALTKKVAGIIRDEMENAVTLCVPILAEVKTGQNRGEMTNTDLLR